MNTQSAADEYNHIQEKIALSERYEAENRTAKSVEAWRSLAQYWRGKLAEWNARNHGQELIRSDAEELGTKGGAAREYEWSPRGNYTTKEPAKPANQVPRNHTKQKLGAWIERLKRERLGYSEQWQAAMRGLAEIFEAFTGKNGAATDEEIAEYEHCRSIQETLVNFYRRKLQQWEQNERLHRELYLETHGEEYKDHVPEAA
jgi:hypothetical protein